MVLSMGPLNWKSRVLIIIRPLLPKSFNITVFMNFNDKGLVYDVFHYLLVGALHLDVVYLMLMHF